MADVLSVHCDRRRSVALPLNVVTALKLCLLTSHFPTVKYARGLDRLGGVRVVLGGPGSVHVQGVGVRLDCRSASPHYFSASEIR
jgi:hypothetical protein